MLRYNLLSILNMVIKGYEHFNRGPWFTQMNKPLTLQYSVFLHQLVWTFRGAKGFFP